MNFKTLQFENPNTQRVYDNYIKSIESTVSQLQKTDQLDVLMEFNSHIYEHIQSNPSEGELDCLLNAIDKLGAPEEVLRPLIADKLMDKATRTFNPLHVFKALLLNLKNGFSYTVFFLLYLFLFTFGFLSIAKLFSSNVGLYFREGKFQAIGLVYNTEGYEEVLGHWFIPVMLGAAVVIYIILTLLLKLKKSITKK